MAGDDLPKTLPDHLSYGFHLFRFAFLESGAALAPPQPEPGLEVRFLEAQRKMLEGHRSPIMGRAAGDAGPKVGDLLDVGWPILHMVFKNRTDQAMLTDIGIEVPNQFAQGCPTTDPVEQ